MHNTKKRKHKKDHDDIGCNMVNMCSNSMDSDLEETENDLEDKRISYQLHHQQVFLDDEEHDEDQVCVASSEIGHVNLRMPSKEEIDRITTEMISQVQSNYKIIIGIVNNDVGKPSSILIKDITHTMKNEDKKASTETIKTKDIQTRKWEPKKKVQFQTNEATKEIVQEKGSGSDATKKLVVPAAPKVLLLGMIMNTLLLVLLTCY